MARADGDDDENVSTTRPFFTRGLTTSVLRGVRHEDVASLVPACSGARVCQEQRQRRLHWFRGPVNQPVRNWSRGARRPRDVSGARRDSGADASHRTVQAWMDSREKTAREGTPQPKNEKSNHCGKERTYSWVRRAGPTAGKQRTITIRIEASQTQITQQDDRGTDDSDSAQR